MMNCLCLGHICAVKNRDGDVKPATCLRDCTTIPVLAAVGYLPFMYTDLDDIIYILHGMPTGAYGVTMKAKTGRILHLPLPNPSPPTRNVLVVFDVSLDFPGGGWDLLAYAALKNEADMERAARLLYELYRPKSRLVDLRRLDREEAYEDENLRIWVDRKKLRVIVDFERENVKR